MHKKQTRVFKEGCFWRVRLLHCGTWITLRGFYLTRAQAREAAAFEAAFEAKWTRPRSFPKTYTPTPKDRLPVPWYLDVNSGVESGKAKSP